MKVVYTLRHRLHHPQREFEASGFQEPLEHPERAEIIRAALAADDTFEFIAPDEWGIEPIEAVHDPGLVQFLETAWEEYQRERGHTHDVVPDVFAMAGAARRHGPGPRAGQHRHEARLVVLRDDHAAHRRAPTTRPDRPSTWRSPRPTTCSTATGGVRAVPPARPPRRDGDLRRLLLLQQRRDRRRAPRVEHRQQGHRARRRLPPRQRHAADLLRPRRRAVRVAARRPAPRLPVPHRLRRRGRRRPRVVAPRRTSRCPARTDDDAYIAALDRGVRRDRGVQARLRGRVARARHVRRRPDRRSRASPPTASRRQAPWCAALGLPTVVLQEGGYAVDELGENARRWLLGVNSLSRPDRPGRA